MSHHSLRGAVIFISLQHFIGSALDLMPCLPSRQRREEIKTLNPRREQQSAAKNVFSMTKSRLFKASQHPQTIFLLFSPKRRKRWEEENMSENGKKGFQPAFGCASTRKLVKIHNNQTFWLAYGNPFQANIGKKEYKEERINIIEWKRRKLYIC